jgi:hypothetical protein
MISLGLELLSFNSIYFILFFLFTGEKNDVFKYDKMTIFYMKNIKRCLKDI